MRHEELKPGAGGSKLYQQMRSKMEADLDKEWWVCLTLLFTMGSLATLARQEAGTMSRTREPRGRPTPW